MCINKKIDYKEEYPSCLLLKDVCYSEYRRLLELYDKIYDKISIGLAFSGVILLVIISGFDYTIISQLCTLDNEALFENLVIFICSAISAICIIISVIQMLSILHGKSMPMLDCMAIRNEELYRECNEVSSMWLIDKFTIIIPKIKRRISKKQRKFDSAVSKIVISIVFYAIALIAKKGV